MFKRTTAFFIAIIFSGLIGVNALPHTAHATPPLTATINDCEELQKIGNDNDYPVGGNYALGNNIDCSMTNPSDPDFDSNGTWQDLRGFKPIGSYTNRFGGIFTGSNGAGGNYAINDLYINRPNWVNGIDRGSNIGLFGIIDEDATVTNLDLLNVNISGRIFVGALAGSLVGHVENINATGTVHGSDGDIGGLVGTHIESGSLNNSSPLVFTWNGQKYDYVADVGDQLPKETSGVDLAQIDDSALVPKDGKYSMKIAQEYNEIVYYDNLSLSTFDHAPGYDVVEPLNRTAGHSDLRTVSKTPTNQLQSCTDMYNHDCKDDLKSNDNKWAYEDPSFDNCWTMDFGDLSASEHTNVQLLMRGARDYTKTPATKMRSVKVKDANGNWVELYNKTTLGSDGTPRLRSIDLTNKFLTNDYHVKVCLDTWQVNYFGIDTSAQVPFTENVYQPNTADLQYHGFTAIDSTHYPLHDYDNVSDQPESLLQTQGGNFTKYGEVKPLLAASDNQFVVMRYGDQMSVDFPYSAVPDGQERSFILNNDVFYKHANLGAIGLDASSPMPYHGMGTFDANTQYPMTTENQAYIAEWNTRHYDVLSHTGGSTIVDSSANVHVVATNSCNVGGLVGYNAKLITGSHANGTVEGSCNVGGLVGRTGVGSTQSGDIEDSYAGGGVTGNNSVGGLVGATSSTTISSSYAVPETVTATGNSVGGLVGDTDNTTITNSFSDVLQVSAVSYVGGLIGNSYDTAVSQSYSVSNVLASGQNVGGFIGYFGGPNGGVSESYASGTVLGAANNVGGFVGYMYQGAITDSYADVDASTDQSISGGFVGLLSGGDLERDYATGIVQAGVSKAGGFVGTVDEADSDIYVKQSFAAGPVSAGSVQGGFAGDLSLAGVDPADFADNYYDADLTEQANCANDSTDVVEGCNAANTNGQNTTLFRAETDQPVHDWDREVVWDFNQDINTGYPCLQWQEGCTNDPVEPALLEVSSSLISAENSTPITLAQTGCSTINTSSTDKETVHKVQDPAYAYPVGFVGFNLTGCTSAADITVTFTGDFDLSKIVLRKYNSALQTYTTLTPANSGLIVAHTTLDGKAAIRAVYRVTDNGPLDQDSALNAITDPVGVGTLSVTVPNTGIERVQ